ncbi:MAG TPA: S8 family serine peptidase [Bacteroidales bacterium]|nr:S8 family serine peptidase [Bacteroidales bacterium]
MRRTTHYARLILMLVFLPLGGLIAQQSTNVEELNRLSRQFDREWRQMEKRVRAYAKTNNIPVRQEFSNGTIIQLVDVVDGQPVFYKTDNIGAAITTRANQMWQGGSVGVVIEGEGYNKVGIWDGGAVRRTHQEFNNTGTARVTQSDGAVTNSDHATHVAGTIVAGGVNANAKGMAHKGQLKAYDWNSVESEMSTAAAAGMEISNHSWGNIRGWDQNQSTGQWTWNGTASVSPVEDYLFGFYNSNARTWDIIALNAPYFLITKSAGNDRGEGPANAGTPGYAEKDGGDDGYDCIGGSGISKNILTVGAVNEVLNYQGPNNVTMSSFSGWGPADDGRIKPDIVGKGVNVYSSVATSNSAYATYSGTSMSSPNVAGSMVLLQQLYQQTHNNVPMRASTLKGLVIHTADEAGPHVGPDYKFGWGLMNTARAGMMIREDAAVQNLIDEITLQSNNPYVRDINVPGNQPLRVTISWTDVQGNVPPASLNPRTRVLVNDLDLMVVDQNLNIYYPYKLDPDNPDAPPTTTGKNNVDNVEQIYIPNPAPGTYTIIVQHEGQLVNNSQVFSLIVSGIDEYSALPECSAGLVSPANGSTGAFLNHLVTWTPAAFATSYDVYFGTDGGGTTPPTNMMNGTNLSTNSFRMNLQPTTTYYLMVKPRNSFGVKDCEIIYSFTTMGVVNTYPYLMTVEGVTAPNMPQGWSGLNYGALNWATTQLIGHNSQKSFALFTTNGQPFLMNNYLVSPPFQVEANKEYKITFAHRTFLPTNPEKLRLLWGTGGDTTSLTNVLYDMPEILTSNWLLGDALLAPGLDGYIFLAWHAYTTSGIGQFIDNIQVEDWGAVGVPESPEKHIKVSHKDGMLTIESTLALQNGEVVVTNAAGQLVFSDRMNGQRYSKPVTLGKGLHIVNVRAAGVEKSTRFIVF